MVYRAREVRSGRRVILKAYDSHTLSNSTRKQALERHVLTLRAAQAAVGPNCGVVLLERVVENTDGTYLVTQACNGACGVSCCVWGALVRCQQACSSGNSSGLIIASWMQRCASGLAP